MIAVLTSGPWRRRGYPESNVSTVTSPGISRRAAAMPASPIRKLVPFADGAKARGIHVYHLNIGQPDVAAPESFWTSMHAARLAVLEYSHSAGIAALRSKAAESYRAMGLPVQADDVLVTVGGSEAVAIAMATICDEGDEVIVPEPMYANYIGFASGIGVKVVALPTRIEDDFALPDAAAFAAKITPRTRAILICNPSNPTGTVYSREQLQALRAIAMEHNLYLVSDEVYRDFVYEGDRPLSVLELEGLEDRTVMIDSVSKRFSLCGARIGFMVCRNPNFMAAAVKFAQARLSASTLEMMGVIGALDAPASYFDEVREEYRRRRDLLVRRLQAMPGVLVPKIEGAFYAAVRLPIDDADRFAQWLLEEFSHEGQTVMVAPLTGFYTTPGQGKDEVRIAYVLKEADLEKAMDCLQVALQTYPGRR
jgi:aspartate aminotransferase